MPEAVQGPAAEEALAPPEGRGYLQSPGGGQSNQRGAAITEDISHKTRLQADGEEGQYPTGEEGSPRNLTGTCPGLWRLEEPLPKQQADLKFVKSLHHLLIPDPE